MGRGSSEVAIASAETRHTPRFALTFNRIDVGVWVSGRDEKVREGHEEETLELR